MNTRDDCSTIHLKTNGIIKTISPKDTNKTTIAPLTTHATPNITDTILDICRSMTYVPDQTNTAKHQRESMIRSSSAPETMDQDFQEMYLCSKTVIPEKIMSQKLFLSGNITTLEYNLPCLLPNVGFVFRYTSYPHYNLKLKKSQPRPFYITYSGLVIYSPIGVILGMIIISLHMRRRGPSSKKIFKGSNIEITDNSTVECSNTYQINTADTGSTLVTAGLKVSLSPPGTIKSIIKNSISNTHCNHNLDTDIVRSNSFTPCSGDNIYIVEHELSCYSSHPKLASGKSTRLSKHVKFKSLSADGL